MIFWTSIDLLLDLLLDLFIDFLIDFLIDFPPGCPRALSSECSLQHVSVQVKEADSEICRMCSSVCMFARAADA